MKYVDEYRDREKAHALTRAIASLVASIPLAIDRPLKVMEVCGGHTSTSTAIGRKRMR
jgi:hydrogenase expression/formation protein HypD